MPREPNILESPYQLLDALVSGRGPTGPQPTPFEWPAGLAVRSSPTFPEQPVPDMPGVGAEQYDFTDLWARATPAEKAVLMGAIVSKVLPMAGGGVGPAGFRSLRPTVSGRRVPTPVPGPPPGTPAGIQAYRTARPGLSPERIGDVLTRESLSEGFSQPPTWEWLRGRTPPGFSGTTERPALEEWLFGHLSDAVQEAYLKTTPGSAEALGLARLFDATNVHDLVSRLDLAGSDLTGPGREVLRRAWSPDAQTVLGLSLHDEHRPTFPRVDPDVAPTTRELVHEFLGNQYYAQPDVPSNISTRQSATLRPISDRLNQLSHSDPTFPDAYAAAVEEGVQALGGGPRKSLMKRFPHRRGGDLPPVVEPPLLPGGREPSDADLVPLDTSAPPSDRPPFPIVGHPPWHLVRIRLTGQVPFSAMIHGENQEQAVANAAWNWVIPATSVEYIRMLEGHER